eukprot:jgi/Undpi1/6697/HiC_scaffold_20.g09176.m1
MQAYTGALGELREGMQESTFASWTREQLQELLVDNNFEVRGSSGLSRASLVAILEKTFRGCVEAPQPPPPLSEETKKRREIAARVVDTNSDGHVEANPLYSPRGVMRAAIRSRISEDTPWEAPSIEAAKAFQDAMHPRRPEGGKFDAETSTMGRYCFLGGCGEQLDLWDEGKTSDFAQYGAGVTSYFKFIKFCSWSFLVVSAAVVPHIFVNTNGEAITTVTTNADKMSWTTVGNLGSSTNFTSVSAVLPFCDEEEYSTCTIEKEALGMYYGYLDAFMVLLLIAGYFWVNSFIRDEFETIKKNTVTAGDFTVLVQNIPPRVTELEISNHFSTILNSNVVEVAIAKDNRRCIELYAKSGLLYHERATTRDLIRYLKTKAQEANGAGRTQKEEENREASIKNPPSLWMTGLTLPRGPEVKGGPPTSREGPIGRWLRERKIRKLRAKRSNASREILHLAAEAKLAAKMQSESVAAYVTFEEEDAAIAARVKYSGTWFSRLFMKKQLRLNGRRIRVSEAPEPSTILWENYGYARWELCARRTFSFLVGASFLTLSISMSIIALYQNQEAERKGGATECPTDWDSLSSQEQIDAVEEDDGILHCLCAHQDSGLLALDPSNVCYDYVRAKLEATWLVLGTSFMVAFTNAAINKITKLMGAFEKHRSVDTQEVSIFRRLVLLKFVNIGLTVLVTNSRRVINLVEVDLDYEDDFTSEWYRTLGSSLVMNVLLNAVTPHLYWLGLWAKKEYTWKYKRHTAISQDALNNLTKGARWEVSVRYAEISVIFAVCLAYSAGIPLLLPIGAVSFLVFYWVEKALFVHFYLTPPQFSGKLTTEVITLIPYTLWIHVVFAFYMYGNGSIFPTSVDTSDTFNFTGKLRVAAVQPLLVPFAILSALILERWLGSAVISGFARTAAVLTCGGKIASRKLVKMRNTITVSYSRAVVRGILRGLPSYNILLNPKYKESFCLSDSFACQHKRVGSVFMMLREHPSILEVKKAMHDSRVKARRLKSPKWSSRLGKGSDDSRSFSSSGDDASHGEDEEMAATARAGAGQTFFAETEKPKHPLEQEHVFGDDQEHVFSDSESDDNSRGNPRRAKR